jgi:hypothetical protein
MGMFSSTANEIIQGVPEVLERFREVISQKPMGLQKQHGSQKMRFILKFYVGI